MKLLVVGTGVIGSLYAIALSGQNCITHLAHQPKLASWNHKTINYDILDERKPKKDRYTKGVYTYRCVSKVTTHYDLIIVPIRFDQLGAFFAQINSSAPSSKYLILASNWTGTAAMDAVLQPEQYVLGYAGGGGTFKDNNSLLWGNIGNDVLLGSVHHEQTALLNVVRDLFQDSGIAPEMPASVLHALWLHNVASAPFGAALSKHMDIEKTFADKELGRTCFKAFKECYKVLEARGVNLGQFPETRIFKALFTLPYFIQSALFRKNLQGEAAQRYTAHAIQSVEEMLGNFRMILTSARELSVKIPNMEKLDTLIRQTTGT